jgi:hypothetical protein
LIAKEKVHRLVIEKFTSGRSSNMSRLNLRDVSYKTKPNDVLCKSYGLLEGTRGKGCRINPNARFVIIFE